MIYTSIYFPEVFLGFIFSNTNFIHVYTLCMHSQVPAEQ